MPFRKFKNNGPGFGEKPVKEGETYDIIIEGIGSKGDGIGKVQGFVLVVPGVQKGDNVKVKVTAVRGKVAFGEAVGKGEAVPVVESEPKEDSQETEETAEVSEEASSEEDGSDSETEEAEPDSEEDSEEESPDSEEEPVESGEETEKKEE